MKKLESSFANMVIVLTIITVIAASCLGAMNNLTAEPIAASKKAKQEAAIKAVLPEFTSLEEDNVNDQKIFRAYNANSELVGIAIETTELGFGGNITTIVGIDANGTIVDYSLLQHAETPGLGSKLVDWFKVKSNIRGADANKMPLNVSKDGGEYDAITAATISSRAFLNSINKAYETYQIAKGETPSVDAWSGATTINTTDSVATTDSTAIDAWSGATAQTDSLNSQLSTLN
ncbi:MAG: RnfABCDGE type electron transport complex subunit G [Paludibacteraceae bacterium]|nr:RnfABCDGE type electron transport complex subunit G [Paludibacteraceae bacterium]